MSDLEDAMAFYIKAERLPKPIREWRFHPERKWRFDFAWPGQRVALEVEGGSWVNGAHGRGKHFENDCIKYSEAALLGWKVLRVTTDMVNDGRAILLLRRAFESEAA